jgi:hypothetical protein
MDETSISEPTKGPVGGVEAEARGFGARHSGMPPTALFSDQLLVSNWRKFFVGLDVITTL